MLAVVCCTPYIDRPWLNYSGSCMNKGTTGHRMWLACTQLQNYCTVEDGKKRKKFSLLHLTFSWILVLLAGYSSGFLTLFMNTDVRVFGGLLQNSWAWSDEIFHEPRQKPRTRSLKRRKWFRANTKYVYCSFVTISLVKTCFCVLQVFPWAQNRVHLGYSWLA